MEGEHHTNFTKIWLEKLNRTDNLEGLGKGVMIILQQT
jgi:hypothetical protein